MTTDTTRQRQATFSLDAIPRRNLSELARRTGYTVRTIQRWNTTGIPLHSADQLACRLGLHPANIWPTWYHQP
jgi:lambda repressor-like predicted transcriptional regulator